MAKKKNGKTNPVNQFGRSLLSDWDSSRLKLNPNARQLKQYAWESTND